MDENTLNFVLQLFTCVKKLISSQKPKIHYNHTLIVLNGHS